MIKPNIITNPGADQPIGKLEPLRGPKKKKDRMIDEYGPQSPMWLDAKKKINASKVTLKVTEMGSPEGQAIIDGQEKELLDAE